MIIFHTITGLLSIIAGLAIIMLNKGTSLHRVAGRVYVISMYVLCLVSFTIRDTTPFFKGLGMFHIMALVSLGTVTAGLVPALYRRKFKDWYEWHYSFMLWSYVGLIMAFNSHFTREVFLFFGKEMGLGKWAGLILSILILWGVPPLAGTILINRRAPVYKRKYGDGIIGA